jgi:hypothetical protein
MFFQRTLHITRKAHYKKVVALAVELTTQLVRIHLYLMFIACL